MNSAPPPSSHETERAVLGILLTDNDVNSRQELRDLTEQDFHDQNHQKLFRVIKKTLAETGAVDPILVRDRLSSVRLNGNLSIAEWISGLAEDYHNAVNLSIYVRDLRELSRRRRLHSLSEELLAAAQNGRSLADVHGLIERELDLLQPEDSPNSYTDLRGDSITLTTAEDFLLMTTESTEWIVPGWIPKSSVVQLYGRWGIGKSILTLDLASAVATATPFAKQDIEHYFDVIWLPLEDPPPVVKDRLSQLPHEARSRIHIPVIQREGMNPVSPSLSLEHPGFERFLTNIIDKTEARLVIVDPLRHIFHGDENDSTAAARGLRTLSSIAHRTGTAILFVHHEGKGGGDDDSRSFRGSSAWGAEVDVLLRLTIHKGPPEKPEALRLGCGKMRVDKAPNPAFCRVTDEPRIEWMQEEPLSDTDERILETLADGEELTATEISEAAEIDRKTAQNRVTVLSDLGKVERKPVTGSRAFAYYLLPHQRMSRQSSPYRNGTSGHSRDTSSNHQP